MHPRNRPYSYKLLTINNYVNCLLNLHLPVRFVYFTHRFLRKSLCKYGLFSLICSKGFFLQIRSHKLCTTNRFNLTLLQLEHYKQRFNLTLLLLEHYKQRFNLTLLPLEHYKQRFNFTFLPLEAYIYVPLNNY